MIVLKVKGKEYKIKFNYNSFCDTDILEKTNDILKVIKKDSEEDVEQIGKLKEVFICVRELLFVGFKKENPVETVQDIGDILDDYIEEETKEERSIFQLFNMITEELTTKGFLSHQPPQTKKE